MNKTYGSGVFIAILIFIFLIGPFFYRKYSRHQSLLIQDKTGEAESCYTFCKITLKKNKDHLEIIANLWKGQSSSEQEEMFHEFAQEMVNLFPAHRLLFSR